MAEDASRQAGIRLNPMPQLAEARYADDDWTGLTDAAARRKRQTRLNTRAYRRRKALQAAGKPTLNMDGGVSCWDEQHQAVSILPASVATYYNKPLILKKHAPTRIIFPLSSDHLITLIQINVLRACITNSQLVSVLIPSVMPHDCTNGSMRTMPRLDNPKHIPENLAPTNIQSTVPHEPWIDIFPHPKWRDNFIQALGTFDEFDLCSDLVGGLFEGGTPSECERRGIIVWSPPWDFNGWELSEGFLQKWGWSIKGCDDVLEATNKWRLLRGEEALRAQF